MDLGVFSYYVYRLAGVAAPRIGPQAGYRLAEQIGMTAYRWSPWRGNVENNVSHILEAPASSPHVRRVARQIFRNQAKNYFDLLRLPKLTSDDVREAARFTSGFEHLDRALARGRGVVLTSAHFGNFDLAAQVLSLHGYKVTALAEHLQPERLFQYVCRLRESHGLRFIPIDGSLRPVFTALRANEMVATALDRNVTDHGRLVEFLGTPAYLPDGYAKLALRTGAALVACFCRRLPDNTFAITVEPEVEIEQSGDMQQDVLRSMRQILSIFETYLRRYPDQWVYFQPVWPAGHPAYDPLGHDEQRKRFPF